MGKTYELDITILCAGMPMTGDMITAGKSLGGSETGALQLSEELVRQGHKVSLFCNTEKPHENNDVYFSPVGWVQGQQGGAFPKGFIDYCRSTPMDVIIVQRLPALMGFDFKSKVNFLWQHDLATRSGPSAFHPMLWNIDKIFVLSEFMKKQYQQVHGGPDRLYHITRNGIDTGLIDETPDSIERDRFAITYNSRPERGLDILLTRVFPAILKREPRAKLYLSRYDDPKALPLYDELAQVAKQFGDRVENLGNMGKVDLYKHYKKCRMFVYPSAFEEVSCISVNEVGACGAVFVGPWRGALPETCAGGHVLIRDDGSIGRIGDPIDQGFKGVSDTFVESFAENVVDLMHDDDRWNMIANKARTQARQWTWEGVAKDWVDLAHEKIADRTAEPKRMLKHFLANSDVVAAKKLVERSENRMLKRSYDRYVKSYVPFMEIEDLEERARAIPAFYEQRSGGDRANWQTAFWADTEPRCKLVLDWIGRHREQVKTVLDFGCAHGGYARAISNAFPDIKVLGVDFSPSLIRCAWELHRGKLPDGNPACKYKDKLEFAIGDENAIQHEVSSAQWAGDAIDNGFDLVLAMDVLEHLPNSENVARNLERYCRDDGWMLITVPNDHRERDEFVMKGIAPVHVRAFDLHDMREMFGARKSYCCLCFSELKELELDNSFTGAFMVTYQKDDKRVGDIDWDRKLTLQGPRETLAVCIITNNCEDTFRQTLKSVHKIADQLIILDNGPSTDKTVEIANEFNADVRAGTNPFYCYTHFTIHPQDGIQPGLCKMAGFETPRNESIEGVWTDWIWWIDSDEQLLEPAKMLKYLRPNIYPGYAINQHHLSVDPPGALKRDIPVRLFRNRAGFKFYGIVHEHAEIGPNKGIGVDCAVLHDLNVSHPAYLTEKIRRDRFKRNIKLLECDRLKYPDRILGIYLYEIRDNMHLARYALEGSGGKITPDITRYCQTVITTFQKHFLGKELLLSTEGLQYYSAALEILGLGVEASVGIDIKQVGSNINGNVQKFRAMNGDEIKKIFASQIDQKVAPLMGPYVS